MAMELRFRGPDVRFALIFFRCALLLPFVLPLCGLGLAIAGVPNIFIIALPSLAYGGAPYLVFAALAWRWMRGKTHRRIFLFGLLAPLIFIPFQVAFMLSLWVFRGALWRYLGSWGLRDCFEISYFVLFFGYGYVFVVLLLWGILEISTKGKFRPSD